MTLQERKDKADIVAKLIDSIYKKLIVLLAVSGAFGTYAIKYIEANSPIGFIYAFVFVVVSIAIFVSYAKMNFWIKELERFSDE